MLPPHARPSRQVVARESWLDSRRPEYAGSISQDELTLIFLSDRPPSQGPDVWRAKRSEASAPFSQPDRLASASSTAIEYQVFLAFDESAVYVCSDGLGNPDLYLSRAVGLDFGPLEPVPEATPNTINSGAGENAPVLTADGLALYFGSNRPGSASYDVWVACRDDVEQPFGEPVHVTGVNSVEDEYPISVSPDGRFLYLTRGQTYVAERLP